MKVDMIISADHIKTDYLKGKVAVVIDILRATSVITTAIANGAKRVIPLLTVEEAIKKADELKEKGEKVVLGGERKALKINGFDFSNSPLEYTKDEVKNKTVIMTTTNGTRALNLCKDADNVFIGSLLNAKYIAREIKKLNKDVVFVNAGTNGQFSMDDFICAGYMIDCLSEDNNCNLMDIATTARYIYKNNINVIDFIKGASHYEVLKSLELEEDLEYCCCKDIIKETPQFINGEIK